MSRFKKYQNQKYKYENLEKGTEIKVEIYSSMEGEYKNKNEEIQKDEVILNQEKNNLKNRKLKCEKSQEQLKRKKQEIQDLNEEKKEFDNSLILSQSSIKKLEYSGYSKYNSFISNSIFNNNVNNYNNYNNIQKQFNKVLSFAKIKIEGLKGFMNPILQCFFHTNPLINYLLNMNNKKNILVNQSNHKQSPLNLKLVEKFWNNQTKNNIYKLYSFINRIENMNYNNNKIGFEEDLIIFILEQLDFELFQHNNELNKFLRGNAFEHFLNEFKNKNFIISEIFFGFKETKNECLNCKSIYNSQNKENPIYYSYETFKYFTFPLEKIKDMKNNYNNNIVSIKDCFEYNQRDIILQRIYCFNCKKECDLNTSSKILVGPNILIIILDRGNNNPYVKLDIQLTIDLTNFILEKESHIIMYDLYGIFSYFGNDASSPYMACCLNQNDSLWYKFNKENIIQINDIQKDFIESGKPFILFYKKQNYNINIFNNLIIK